MVLEGQECGAGICSVSGEGLMIEEWKGACVEEKHRREKFQAHLMTTCSRDNQPTALGTALMPSWG